MSFPPSAFFLFIAAAAFIFSVGDSSGHKAAVADAGTELSAPLPANPPRQPGCPPCLAHPIGGICCMFVFQVGRPSANQHPPAPARLLSQVWAHPQALWPGLSTAGSEGRGLRVPARSPASRLERTFPQWPLLPLCARQQCSQDSTLPRTLPSQPLEEGSPVARSPAGPREPTQWSLVRPWPGSQTGHLL